jgi:hypothetical protein
VRRVDGGVFIHHVDHVVTDDQITAFGKVIASAVGGQRITWEQALQQAREDRLRLVRGDTGPAS